MTKPAAFRRLCVETAKYCRIYEKGRPAAFRRLCVETSLLRRLLIKGIPAAFRRLCVETGLLPLANSNKSSSRLQAAVC